MCYCCLSNSIPKSKLKSYSDRDFSVVVPEIWNEIPLEISLSSTLGIFKSHLKTYFLKQTDIYINI